MGKKSECIRVPILLRMDNPRHQLVYNILENVDNKSAYIREAVIYYYRHNGISMKSDDILDDIRNVIQECKEELLIELENRSGGAAVRHGACGLHPGEHSAS